MSPRDTRLDSAAGAADADSWWRVLVGVAAAIVLSAAFVAATRPAPVSTATFLLLSGALLLELYELRWFARREAPRTRDLPDDGERSAPWVRLSVATVALLIWVVVVLRAGRPQGVGFTLTLVSAVAILLVYLWPYWAGTDTRRRP